MHMFGTPSILEKDAHSMTDCNYVMTKYLLDQYLFYRYRDMFSFIVAGLLVPAILQFFKMKNGSYYGTYIFFFIIWYAVKVSITVVIKQMIPKTALHKLLTRCEGWQTDPKTVGSCKSVINPKLASQYLKESFQGEPTPTPTQAVIMDDEDESTAVSSVKSNIPTASNAVVSESFSNPTLMGTSVCKNMYAPLNSKCAPGCMQDNNMRKTACLGLEPTSDINYPGGGAYQVQSAATVQTRLTNNNFLPGNCLDLLQG